MTGAAMTMEWRLFFCRIAAEIRFPRSATHFYISHYERLSIKTKRFSTFLTGSVHEHSDLVESRG
jgi:hypothetical protein